MVKYARSVQGLMFFVVLISIMLTGLALRTKARALHLAAKEHALEEIRWNEDTLECDNDTRSLLLTLHNGMPTESEKLKINNLLKSVKKTREYCVAKASYHARWKIIYEDVASHPWRQIRQGPTEPKEPVRDSAANQ